MAMNKKAPLGSGAAKKAGSTIEARKAYNKYAVDEQSAGNTPKPFKEWAKEQGYDIVDAG